MYSRIKIVLLFTAVLFTTAATAQEVSGTVLDMSRKNYIPGVQVFSTAGVSNFTDSTGRYVIRADRTDSIYFVYNNKPTQKFPVSAIQNSWQFDVSLPVAVQSKYTVLKEVTVYAKDYREDSADNRETYRKIFEYHKPRIETSITPAGVGMDVNELINMFRFRRNRRLKDFQKRLEAREQEKYVDYRFNKLTVKRITQLQTPALDSFLVWYRPSYEFTSESTEIQFTQYVLNAYYQFKRLGGVGKAKLDEE